MDDDVTKEALMISHLVQVGDTTGAVLRIYDLMAKGWRMGWDAFPQGMSVLDNPFEEKVGSS